MLGSLSLLVPLPLAFGTGLALGCITFVSLVPGTIEAVSILCNPPLLGGCGSTVAPLMGGCGGTVACFGSDSLCEVAGLSGVRGSISDALCCLLFRVLLLALANMGSPFSSKVTVLVSVSATGGTSLFFPANIPWSEAVIGVADSALRKAPEIIDLD